MQCGYFDKNSNLFALKLSEKSVNEKKIFWINYIKQIVYVRQDKETKSNRNTIIIHLPQANVRYIGNLDFFFLNTMVTVVATLIPSVNIRKNTTRNE